MFEWKVNQIQVGLMERVLNHMEKQGYEVQLIIPMVAEDNEGQAKKSEVLLAGKKSLATKVVEAQKGLPAVTPENLDIVYGRSRDAPCV